jgi:hypothetical protein
MYHIYMQVGYTSIIKSQSENRGMTYTQTYMC